MVRGWFLSKFNFPAGHKWHVWWGGKELGDRLGTEGSSPPSALRPHRPICDDSMLKIRRSLR